MDANANQVVLLTLCHGRDGAKGRPDRHSLPYVAVKSVPGRDTSDPDVRRWHRSGVRLRAVTVPNDVSVD